VIKDGLVALNYLLKRDPYKDSQTHDLVLLDIKLPSKNGFEIPKELRANTALNNLKVIMLTTGDSVESFEENYQVKANDYLEKPILLDKLDQCLSSLN
jgi:two-component system, chemotaxis family, response regulator Rcp1